MAASVTDLVDEIRDLLMQDERARSEGWYLLADEVNDDPSEDGTEHWYYVPIVFPHGSPDDLGAYRFLSSVEDRIADVHKGDGIRVLLVPAI
jgi:hypothetical protein